MTEKTFLMGLGVFFILILMYDKSATRPGKPNKKTWKKKKESKRN